jgi:hypothetical protein
VSTVLGLQNHKLNIRLTLNNGKFPVSCLIDTGSSVTLMRGNVFKKLCDLTGKPAWLSKTIQLNSVSGQRLNVQGQTPLKFDSCPVTDVVIVNDIVRECILGIDFLRQANATLDISGNKVKLFDKIYVCKSSHENVVSTVSSDTEHTEVNEVILSNDDIFSNDKINLGKCIIEPCSIDTGNTPPYQTTSIQITT